MTKTTATSAHLANEVGYELIKAVFKEELEQFLGRCRYGRSGEAKAGYHHGHPLPDS